MFSLVQLFGSVSEPLSIQGVVVEVVVVRAVVVASNEDLIETVILRLCLISFHDKGRILKAQIISPLLVNFTSTTHFNNNISNNNDNDNNISNQNQQQLFRVCVVFIIVAKF